MFADLRPAELEQLRKAAGENAVWRLSEDCVATFNGWPFASRTQNVKHPACVCVQQLQGCMQTHCP